MIDNREKIEIGQFFQKNDVREVIAPVPIGTRFVLGAPARVIADRDLIYVYRNVTMHPAFTGLLTFGGMVGDIDSNSIELVLKSSNGEQLIGSQFLGTAFEGGQPFNIFITKIIKLNHVLLPGTSLIFYVINGSATDCTVHITLNFSLFDKNVLEHFRITDIMKFCNEIN